MIAGQGEFMGRLSASFVIVLTVLGLVFTAPASAAKIDNQFRTWLENDLWPEAQANGVSKATFDAAFAGVTPNLELPDLVMPGEKPKTPKKQLQAEFGSPGNYFAEKTIGAVTAGGRSRCRETCKDACGDREALWRAWRGGAGDLGPRVRLRRGQDSL